MTYTEFELVDFANYVLNHRSMSSQNGDVGHNEFMGWLEQRKPQEFIRRVREYKLDLLFNYEDKEIKFTKEEYLKLQNIRNIGNCWGPSMERHYLEFLDVDWNLVKREYKINEILK